jgi:hypothetical protein
MLFDYSQQSLPFEVLSHVLIPSTAMTPVATPQPMGPSPPASGAYQTPVNGSSYFDVMSFLEQECLETSRNPQGIGFHDGEAMTTFSSGCNSPLPPASPGLQTYPVAEFVNLQDLTSSALEATVPIPAVQQFPPLPTLSTEDDEYNFALGTVAFPITPENDIADHFSCTIEPPSFELNSDEFSFVNFTPQNNIVYKGEKRQKIVANPYDEEDFISVQSFGSFDDEDYTAYAALTDSKNTQRRMKRAMSASDSESHYDEGQNKAPSSTASQSQPSSNDGNAVASNTKGAHSPTVPVNRRSRKQSKTFVCTICFRSFVLKKNLRRHHKSLHALDKPFECKDCGKRFPRSDNLAQHERSHGNGVNEILRLMQGSCTRSPFDERSTCPVRLP